MKRSDIDWQRVRQRVEAGAGALKEALAESPSRIEAAYRQRAERLASRPAATSAVPALKVLVFRVEQERYAIALTDLIEVLTSERCTAVPGAPRLIEGVINVRGELRAVVNLGRLLAPSQEKMSASRFVLMVRCPGGQIGLKVDRVEDLREIEIEELSPPVEASYAKGVIAGPLILLDLDRVRAKVLSEEERLTA